MAAHGRFLEGGYDGSWRYAPRVVMLLEHHRTISEATSLPDSSVYTVLGLRCYPRAARFSLLTHRRRPCPPNKATKNLIHVDEPLRFENSAGLLFFRHKLTARDTHLLKTSDKIVKSSERLRDIIEFESSKTWKKFNCIKGQHQCYSIDFWTFFLG